jgi:hypothetical protein
VTDDFDFRTLTIADSSAHGVLCHAYTQRDGIRHQESDCDIVKNTVLALASIDTQSKEDHSIMAQRKLSHTFA